MRRIKIQRSPIIRVKVTTLHRDRAIQNSSSHCMIADAIRERYAKFTHVSVDLQTIRLSDPTKGLRYVYLTPRVCQQALVLFDQGRKNREFEFTLRGAHTIGMNLTNRQKGKPVRERLQLGRRRIIPGGPITSARGKASVPDIIGGKPVRRHPSSSGERTFGLRAFTQPDLDELGLA